MQRSRARRSSPPRLRGTLDRIVRSTSVLTRASLVGSPGDPLLRSIPGRRNSPVLVLGFPIDASERDRGRGSGWEDGGEFEGCGTTRTTTRSQVCRRWKATRAATNPRATRGWWRGRREVRRARPFRMGSKRGTNGCAKLQMNKGDSMVARHQAHG